MKISTTDFLTAFEQAKKITYFSVFSITDILEVGLIIN
jgi:hypothetical protein